MIKRKTRSKRNENHIVQRMGLAVKEKEVALNKSCIWKPPEVGQVKANTGGSLQQEQNRASIGISFRDSGGEFIAVVIMGAGELDIFWLKTLAIIVAMEVAIDKGRGDVWIESDSLSVVQSINENQIPWKLT